MPSDRSDVDHSKSGTEEAKGGSQTDLMSVSIRY